MPSVSLVTRDSSWAARVRKHEIRAAERGGGYKNPPLRPTKMRFKETEHGWKTIYDDGSNEVSRSFEGTKKRVPVTAVETSRMRS
ncbi:hypothetical protein BH09CHL1_BH09CHL1_03270 [soil metagenome]